MKKVNYSSASLRQRQYVQAIAVVAGLILAGSSQAATFTWDGNGGVGSTAWSNAANWNPDGAPANDGTDDIHMAGTAKLSNRPNGGFDINSLTFDAGAGAFTINKLNALDVIALEGGGIVNNSVNNQTINADISLFASQTFDAAAGNLTYGGLVDVFSQTLTIAGANNSTFGGVVQGLGSITKDGAGTLTLSGASTYSGGTVVNAGTLALGNNSGAGSAGITLNGGELQAAGGSRTIANSVALAGGSIGGSQNLTLSGVVTGAGTLTKNGSGTTSLNSANPGFTGGVVVNAGSLSLPVANALQNAASVALNGGSLDLTGSGNRVNDAAPLSLNGGSLNANNSTESFGALSVASASSINLSADATPGTLTFASYTPGSSLTINGWSGTFDLSVPPTAGTDDRIFVTADPGSSFFSEITFTGFGSGAVRLGTGELVPVPEPKTILSAIALLGFGAWRFFTKRNGKALRLA
jgi:autotransporter-associated beta strand protein